MEAARPAIPDPTMIAFLLIVEVGQIGSDNYV
jgi:hypothetical protein